MIQGVALIELLTEGYVFFRRVLSTVSSIDTFMEAPPAAKMKYTLVPNDSSYLYLIGISYMEMIYPDKDSRPVDINLCVLTAIADTLELRANNDARTIVTDFARQLGLNAQEAHSGFVEAIDKVLRKMGSKMNHVDPVYQLLTTTNADLDGLSDSVIKQLGVTPKHWSALKTKASVEQMTIPWLTAMNKPVAIKLHRSQLFIYIMRAAADQATLKYDPVMEVGTGPDGLVILLPAILSFERAGTTMPLKLMTYPVFTNDMVKAYESNLMRRAGYVRTDKDGWYPREATVVREVVIGGRTTLSISPSDSVPPEQDTTSMDNVVSAITSAVKGQASAKLVKKAESLAASSPPARMIQAGALRWLRKKGIKF